MRYRKWIKYFKYDPNAIGDLARDIIRDPNFPNIKDGEEGLVYLQSMNAIPEALLTFKRSWLKFVNFNRGVTNA